MRKLNVLAVDDERLAVFNLAWTLDQISLVGDVQWFLTAKEALDWLDANEVDVAFLDIEMRDMNGLELARRIAEKHPSTSIVFLTGYSEYAVEAFRMKAYGYLLKPVAKRDVERELKGIYARLEAAEGSGTAGDKALPHALLRVQTFGDFEAFLPDGSPLHFTRRMCKEVLAYLVDRRGAGVTSAELASVVLAGRPYDRSNQKYLQTVISDLVKSLKAVHAEGVIVRFRNHLSVDTSLLDCDYYQLLEGDDEAWGGFTGEYLSNYGWAKDTAVSLRGKAAARG